MDEALAVITLDSQNRTIIDLTLAQKQFRFKCKRCASLCCKLGGPVITQKDAELIESASYCVNNFLEPINRNADYSPLVYGSLKTRKDGSCIFLKFDAEQKCHNCSIYDFRPTLCRLYPFSFERIGYNKIALKIIPCCMGLNSPEDKVMDEKYISSRLLEPLFEAMELLQKDTLH